MPKPSSPTDKNAASVLPNGLPHGVRRYDFRLPRKLSQPQRVKLGGLYSRLTGRIAERFSALLHMPVEATFLGLEQVQVGGLQNPEEPDAIVVEVDFEPGPGRCYLSWNRKLAFFIMERLLGGSGEELFVDEGLSDFETGIMRRITSLVSQELTAELTHASLAKSETQGVLPNKQAFIEACGPEVLLIASFALHVEPMHGKLEILVPYGLVKVMLNEAEPETETGGNGEADLPPALAGAAVTLSVRFKGTLVRLSDFMSLQAGDCLQINHFTREAVDVYANGRLKFRGYLGLHGKHLAIKIAAIATAPAAAESEQKSGGITHGTAK